MWRGRTIILHAVFTLFAIANIQCARRFGVNVRGLTVEPGFTFPTSPPRVLCPSEHPFPIARGKHCCSGLFRLNNVTTEALCNGSTVLRYYSPYANVACCDGGHVACPARRGVVCKQSMKGLEWGSWSPWSQCSLTCGSGIKTRSRVHLCKDAITGASQPCPSSNGTNQQERVACNNYSCACYIYGSSPCIFPMSYLGVMYPTCTTIDDSGDWCAVGVQQPGNVYPLHYNQYGYCRPDCPRCSTVDGPVVNSSCVFPFTFQSVAYRTCTTVDNGQNNGLAWCATGSDPVTQWGICDDARLCPLGN